MPNAGRNLRLTTLSLSLALAGLLFGSAPVFGNAPLFANATALEYGPPAEAASRAAVERDWLRQDHAGKPEECFASQKDSNVERALVARVLEELGSEARPLRKRLDRLVEAKAPGSDPRWRELYLEAAGARRARRLARLRREYPRIVYTRHYDIGGSHYAYTEGQSDAQAERTFKPGTALCLLELSGDQVTSRALIDDPHGVIRDPAVSWDGRRVLFAWKKSDRGDDYHVYELEVESAKVRQITSGKGVADYEPAYLPGGDIVFNSTRCVQIVDCWWTEVSNLYRSDPQGRYLRRLTFDQVHTNYPQVTDDGRVIYTRWDYNDRGQIYPQPLFQMNPDGTGQTALYGNNSWFPTSILQARGIPGTGKVMAVLAGHHTHQRGKLAIIDPALGRQEASGVQLIAPVRRTDAVKIDAYGQSGEQFQYPWPLDERELLVTYCSDAGGNRRYRERFGIYFMDVDGRRELLALDAKVSSNQPVALAPRPKPHRQVTRSDYRRDSGVYYVADVHAGPGLAGVERGVVKRLRVVALEFRAVGIGSNRNGGPAGGAMVSTPVSCDNASWDVKHVLGSTPVYEDGSAMFRVPARTPVYFQLLDEKGRVVQSMRSWSTLQPGEAYSCAGCHENPNDSAEPLGTLTHAARVGPLDLEPFYGPPRGFSFAREIQPILDRKCVRCHDDRAKVPGHESRVSMSPKDMKPLVAAGGEWSYTTAAPEKRWRRGDFSDADWSRGRAGFGTKGTPGGEVRTTWSTPEIWLRRAFDLPRDFQAAGRKFAVWFCHDEDITVWINGRRVVYERGHTGRYKALPIDGGVLRAGPNLIAAHCRQTGGGQFIDVGLLAAEIPEKPKVAAGDGVEHAFSLLGEPNHDGRAKRYWSDAYLALTQKGRPNRIVRWLNVQSVPPMLPPYAAGSAKSELMTLLESGHGGVELTPEEYEKIACWIDLLVPFCGDYAEANAWSEGEKAKYERYMAKRKRYAEIDRANIEALLEARGEAPAGHEVSSAPRGEYRNVALNPHDVRGPARGYPHATSNSECRGEDCFAARCAIDGRTENTGHGRKFPSWGPEKRTDLWWKVELGRPVEVDQVVLRIRADFPHDRFWHRATLRFSDGSRQPIRIEKSAEPQRFRFPKRVVSWLEITDLVQDEPLGWCGFTEVEVWGRDVGEVRVARRSEGAR